MQRIRLLLAECDNEAVELVDELMERLAGAPRAPALRNVARLLEIYEFEDALKALLDVDAD